MKIYQLWCHNEKFEGRPLLFRWKWVRCIYENCQACKILMNGGS